MPEQRSRPRDSRVIALANQKGGTGKTTTTVNLGIGLARLGKKVLLIDADPQGDLTTCLGWQNQDSLPTTLATVMEKVIRDEPFTTDEGIMHHSEGVDLMPANIELSALEMSLVNAMSREFTLRTYVNEAKKHYDVVLIDCMPSLGMITINALAAADSVIIPVQAHYLPAKGMTQLMKTIQGHDPAYENHRQSEAADQPGPEGRRGAAHSGGRAHKPCQTDSRYPAAELRERVENLSFRNSRSHQSRRDQRRRQEHLRLRQGEQGGPGLRGVFKGGAGGWRETAG